MTLKTYLPITPSSRHRRTLVKHHLWKGSPYKPLTKGFISTGGRNHQGKITVRHKGGGHKRTYRFITFHRQPHQTAHILRIEYDPNRSASIALISHQSQYQYILATSDMKPGTVLTSSGIAYPLHQIPIGSYIHNIEGTYVRSAGTYALLISLQDQQATIKLPSKQQITVPNTWIATLGILSNPDHIHQRAGKAGASRWKGHRPTVRGEAMNAVDHPHGGKTHGGRLPSSPWGKLTRGLKTRHAS